MVAVLIFPACSGLVISGRMPLHVGESTLGLSILPVDGLTASEGLMGLGLLGLVIVESLGTSSGSSMLLPPDALGEEL